MDKGMFYIDEYPEEYVNSLNERLGINIEIDNIVTSSISTAMFERNE